MLNSLPYIAFVLLLQPVQVAVALSHLQIQTPGPISQCGRVTIPLAQGNFTDGRADNPAPVSLTILPFNSSNIVIPIAGLSRSSETIQLDFLPVPADVPFLLSLSDARNELLGSLSDVIRIQPSNVTTCLPAASALPVYSIPDRLAQCEVFEISYDASQVTTIPQVKAVSAFGVSYNIEQVDSPEQGAFYALNAFRGAQMALSIDDGQGNSETTVLFSVFGDTTTSAECINFGNFTFEPLDHPQAAAEENGLPIAALVGIGVGIGMFVVLVVGIMVFFVLRARRRRQEDSQLYQDFFMTQGGGENGQPQPPVSQPASGTTILSPTGTSRYIINPVYTTQYYGEDEKPRRSRDSWLAVSVRHASVSSPMGSGVDMVRQQPNVKGKAKSRETGEYPRLNSVTSFDIVRMLDTAESAGQYQLEAESSKHSSQQAVPVQDTPSSKTHLTEVRMSLEDIPTSPVVVSPVTPESAISMEETRVSSRQKKRGPADVPMDPTSFISTASNGMFGSFPQGQLTTGQLDGPGYRFSHLTAASEAVRSPTTPTAPQPQPQAF